ncbi:NlpC/P60 family protein [Streptomyces sp. NBC_01433]|uniref:C40 family peptidase n=1 Tax=Streptomyces sp. NBC_01433 TaxID=2903864 RepID=UPI0022547D73|nr:C40 family peptidase [Streptomyces sp. NBC_01433]MCX4682564.1 NlpC/P60 family protein [Streptomyces sp. NBC_01433]
MASSDLHKEITIEGAGSSGRSRTAGGPPGRPAALLPYGGQFSRCRDSRRWAPRWAGGAPPKTFANGETYNYVKLILSTMGRFKGPGLLTVSGSGSGADALRKASTRMGTPYAYGGGGPGGPSTGFCDGVNGYLNDTCSASKTIGFDCSSLVQYAYWPKLKLPRTAQAQYGATSDRPVSRNDLKPGDLLFWAKGGSGFIYHVAMYAGDGNVLHAPRTGRNVGVAPLTSAMPAGDYVGATRP